MTGWIIGAIVALLAAVFGAIKMKRAGVEEERGREAQATLRTAGELVDAANARIARETKSAKDLEAAKHATAIDAEKELEGSPSEAEAAALLAEARKDR